MIRPVVDLDAIEGAANHLCVAELLAPNPTRTLATVAIAVPDRKEKP